MRKFYSLVLIAAGLLIGTNLWAEIHEGDVCKIDNEGYAKLATAIEAVPTTGVETTIELISDVTLADITDFNIEHDTRHNSEHVLGIYGGRNVKLELNGKNIRFENSSYNTIIVNGGTLTINNKETALSTISFPNVQGVQKMINVYGTENDVDQANYSTLTIGKNIALTSLYNEYYGVMVPANGYGATINLDCQITTSAPCVYTNGSFQKTSVNVPQITIGENAVLVNTNDADGSASIYAAGFAKWQINGSTIISSGAGVYIKGGQLTLDGVTIHATGEYKAPVENGNGFDANGSAIIVDSHKGYVKEDMSLTITGNTQITSDHGWAIEEVATKGSDKLPTVNLESGDFKGELGALTMTDEKQQDMVVKGTLTGGTYNSDIAPYVSNVDGVISYKIVDGTTQWTIGKVGEEGWITDGTTTGENIKLESKQAETKGDEAAGYVFLKENSTLTVKEGTTYTVEQLVVDNTSNVVVEKGGTLLITGDNGIISTNTDNLEIHTQEGKPGVLLINPEVTFNTTPHATVELIANSYTNPTNKTDFRNHRFGIPTAGAVESIAAKDADGNDVQVGFAGWVNNAWTTLGFINVEGKTLDLNKLNKPFSYYQLQCNTPQVGTKVIFTGALVGNTSPSLTAKANEWVTFANSYSANMDCSAMLEMLDNESSSADIAIYTYSPTFSASQNGAFTWKPFDYTVYEFEGKIMLEPMQAFIIKNGATQSEFQLDYNSMVWEPAHPSSNTPARKMATIADLTKVCVNVFNTTGKVDAVYMLQANQFSSDVENGYDSEKLLNDNANLYVMAQRKQCTMATDDLNGTYLGFSCETAGQYTIGFEQLAGDEFELVDLVKNIRVPMTETAQYTFAAQAGEKNDYRFQIVKRAKGVVTGMEEVQSIDKRKAGIFTMTGQYIGNMSKWHTLPTGVYVVDGEKMVK